MRKQINIFNVYIWIFAMFFSCNTNHKIDPKIESYVDTALDSIQANALFSQNVDWSKLREEVKIKVRDAKKTSDTYDALAYALEQLQDNHSFLQKNGQNLSYSESKNDRGLSPYNKRMKIEYGLHIKNGIKVARIFVPQGMRDNKFSQKLQNIIYDLSSKSPSGWIIDLRGNGGGNMWPMLAGIGPLVGDNPLGGSSYANGKQDFYLYDDGKAIYKHKNGNTDIYAEAEERPYKLDPLLPTAILIDRGTASSGEALAIILKGQENTKTFGEKSYGASTSTRGIKLKDSLNIVLAQSTFQDRKGNIYPNGIEPDVKIQIGNNMEVPENDPVIEAAISWISKNCCN